MIWNECTNCGGYFSGIGICDVCKEGWKEEDYDMANTKTDIINMVLRCLEAFKAGPYTNQRLVEINWESWEEEPTVEIRCVFQCYATGIVFCDVYPSISGTHGVDLNTGVTWKLDDPILFRKEVEEEEWPGERSIDPGAHFGKMI